MPASLTGVSARYPLKVSAFHQKAEIRHRGIHKHAAGIAREVIVPRDGRREVAYLRSGIGDAHLTGTVLVDGSACDNPGRRAPSSQRGEFHHETGTCDDESLSDGSIGSVRSASHAAPWPCGC